MKKNPIMLEIFKNRFSAIAEEMGVTLNRTAFSSNIKERKDFSCAVFNKNGDIIAQAAHIPVHLGSMPLSVKEAIRSCNFFENDMVILNNPFSGGTHLPDITMVAPVFTDDKSIPQFYVANRAHHSDIGGMSPGSMPLSSSIFQEGLIIPPTKIMRNGIINEEIMNFILQNVRTPDERNGDFTAQIMANLTGVKRICEVIDKHSLKTVDFYAKQLIKYSEKITRQMIRRIPDGTYSFKDYLDDDGLGNKNILIKVDITIKNDTAIVDFSDSGNCVQGNMNAVLPVTLSAVMYVFRSLISEEIPTNAGCFIPVTVKTKKGTIVDAQFPSAVSAGNVETSQRIVDVVLGALSKALPEVIPAASQGTMNNITIGGYNEKGLPFAYYETIAGGMGASPYKNGESAVHSHMTNTLNTPVEALEYTFPFMVNKYAIDEDSGGKGKYCGGNGITREIQLANETAELTIVSERRSRKPYGLSGGKPGREGKNTLIRKTKEISKPGKFRQTMSYGDIIRIQTPGGGGFGQIKNKKLNNNETNK